MSDDEDCLVQQAFDVDLPDNYDPSEIPCDGSSYLRKVMYEARQHPDIVVADMSKVKVAKCTQNQNPECENHQSIPSKMMLSIDEQLEEAAEFSNVRQKIARERAEHPHFKPRQDLPQNMKDWHQFCFGNDSAVTEKDGLREGVLPFFSILASLNQCEILELLDYHVEYLESCQMMSKQQAVWLFSLLAFTEYPLLPDTCSTLRTLARTCASIRETVKSVHDPQLPAFNLFICLVARYFHQSDLGDDPEASDE